MKFKEFCKGITENKLLRIWLHIVHPFFLVIKLMPYASYPPPQQCKQYGEIISEIAYLFLCSCINFNAIWKLKQICLGLTTNKYLVSSTHRLFPSTLKTFVHQAYLRLDRSMKIERRPHYLFTIMNTKKRAPSNFAFQAC